jgi:molybdate transport system substrate-binding protein
MRWLTRTAVLVALSGVLLAACRRPSERRAADPTATTIVRIAAAADLRYALEELIRGFRQQQPRLDISVSYGSSGTAYAQLLNGAPFDLFLSADVTYPRQLAARGLTLEGAEFIYAVGRIVLWVPAASSIDVAAAGMSALAGPGVSHIAIANPEHAPYGRAAEAAMRTAGVYDVAKSKLVLGENVSQALQFVESGAAQIGIVALSLAVAPPVAGRGRYREIPLDTYPQIEQGGTILRWAANPDAARAFREFMLSSAGRAVLNRYGFSLPADVGHAL